MRVSGAKVIAVLDSHFHENFDPDAEHAGREHVPSNDFREVLASHGSRIARIRHRYKQPHANFITSFTGLEKDTGARNADRAAHVFKMVFVGIRRTDAHQLSNPAAAAAAALRVGNRLLWGASCWEFFRHQLVLGRHGESSFRTTAAHYPRRV